MGSVLSNPEANPGPSVGRVGGASLAARIDVHRDVAHDRPALGQDVDCEDRPVHPKIGGQDEVPHRLGDGGVEGKRRGQRERDRGLAERPSGVGLGRGRGQVARPLRVPAGRPFQKHVHLVGGQHVAVAEAAEAVLRLPGRHAESENLLTNRLRPRIRLAVGQQRHRANPALDVAAPALALEDGEHVLVVGEAGRNRGVSARDAAEQHDRPEGGDAEGGVRMPHHHHPPELPDCSTTARRRRTGVTHRKPAAAGGFTRCRRRR